MSGPRKWQASFPTTPLKVYAQRRADGAGQSLHDFLRSRGLWLTQLERPEASEWTIDRLCVALGVTPYHFFPDFDRVVEVARPDHGTRARYDRPYECRCSVCREGRSIRIRCAGKAA